MADQENLELDEVLEKITFYCFDEARKKIEAGEECVPFTCVVSGEQMFVESYPGEDVTMCRKNAEANVKSSSSFSSCYAFCYDGFLMTDEGQLDAILVECAQRDMESSYVIGLLYKKEGDQLAGHRDAGVYPGGRDVLRCCRGSGCGGARARARGRRRRDVCSPKGNQ